MLRHKAEKNDAENVDDNADDFHIQSRSFYDYTRNSDTESIKNHSYYAQRYVI